MSLICGQLIVECAPCNCTNRCTLRRRLAQFGRLRPPCHLMMYRCAEQNQRALLVRCGLGVAAALSLPELGPGNSENSPNSATRRPGAAPGGWLGPPGYGSICWPISPRVSPRARARSRRVDRVGNEPSPRSMSRIVRRETSARADSRAIDSRRSCRACRMTRASRIDISSRLGGSISRSVSPVRLEVSRPAMERFRLMVGHVGRFIVKGSGRMWGRSTSPKWPTPSNLQNFDS